MGVIPWIDEVLKFGAQKIFQEETVSAVEAKIRMGICETCDQFNKERKICMICKCFMEVKTTMKIHKNIPKMRSEVTHCPLGKWMDKDIANQYRTIDQLELLT